MTNAKNRLSIVAKAGFALIVILAVCFIGFRAMAQEEQEIPKAYPGQNIWAGNTILCDTGEQLGSILQAQIDGGNFEAGKTRFVELYYTPNALGERVCQYYLRAFLVRIVAYASTYSDVPYPNSNATQYVYEVLWGVNFERRGFINLINPPRDEPKPTGEKI